MQTLELCLFLLAAVILSAVLDQIIPKVSSPLIQIGLGVLIALFSTQQITISMDTELFLPLFVAPLLFIEAKDADKHLLWQNRRPVLALGVGLVVLITLCVGFVLNLLVPSIPLAAAFALGAALGPTDAVSVASFSKSGGVPEHPKSILEGEALINDASGVVSFQFAIAAVTTGAFSLLQATLEFALSFFGGILLGLALGFALRWLNQKVRDIGLENITFHVLFEILTPFAIYLAAETLHVSGILAVVCAGLVGVINPKNIVSPNIARMNIVSSSVWQVLRFALNGVVFVLLGTQLPDAMTRSWEDSNVANTDLFIYIGVILALIVVVRFLWILAMDILGQRRRGPMDKEKLRDALIATLGGAKGAVTLAVILTLPTFVSVGDYVEQFPGRDLLIFVACGVIVGTLLLCNFVTPLLLPKKKRERGATNRIANEALCRIDILRSVIEHLTAEQSSKNELATQQVIESYNARIAKLKSKHGLHDEADAKLRRILIGWERSYVQQLLAAGRVSPLVAYRYLTRLNRTERLIHISRGKGQRLRSFISRTRTSLRAVKRSAIQGLPLINESQKSEALLELQIGACSNVCDKLQEVIADPTAGISTEKASALLLEYQEVVRKLSNRRPSITTITQADNDANIIRRKAYQLELELIDQMQAERRLSRSSAKQLRDNVNLMLIDLEDEV